MKNLQENVNDVSQSLASRKSGRPSAGELQGDELREHIIAAASIVYGASGYRGSTVAKIAQAAGISRPLFYRQFKGRWEVVDIIIKRANEALLYSAAKAMSETEELFPMISAGIDAYFDWCRYYGSVVGPLYQEINDPESPACVHNKNTVKAMVKLLLDMVKKRNLPNYSPFLLETLIHTIEHIGSEIFWPEVQAEPVLRKSRAILQRIVTASLARPEDENQVPSIDSICD